MIRRILIIALAVLALAVAVPFGAALTLEHRLPIAARRFPSAPSYPGDPAPLHDAATLALTGTALIGLAIAVRRVC